VEALSADADYILTTEKDWVKIEYFSFTKPVIVVGIEIIIQPKEKLKKLALR
jgi:tetraacyldisaccharide-1-P 4'-kinase